MGRMKDVYMELYYSFDGCIPENYDHEAHIVDYLNKQEYEKSEKTAKETMSGTDQNSTTA